jgi:hypothetical protein
MKNWRQILGWQVQNSYTVEEMITMLAPHQIWKDARDYSYLFMIGDVIEVVWKEKDSGGEPRYVIQEAIWASSLHSRVSPGCFAYLYLDAGPFELLSEEDINKLSWQVFLGDIDPMDRGIMASLLTADDDHVVALLCIPSDTTIDDIAKDMIDSGFTEEAFLFQDMVKRAKGVAWEATDEFSNVMRIEEIKRYYKVHYPNDELNFIPDWLKVKKAFKEIVDSYNLPDKESSKLSWQDSTYGGKYDIGALVFDPLSKRFGKVTFVGPLSKVEGLDKGKQVYLTKYKIRNEKKDIPSEDDPTVMLLDLNVGFAHYEGNIQSPNEFMTIDPPKTVIRGLTSGVKKVKKLPEEGDSHEDIFETSSPNHTYFKDARLSLEVVGQGIFKLSWQIQEPVLKVGDKVKIIAFLKKLRDLDIVFYARNTDEFDPNTIYEVASIDTSEVGTMGIYSDNMWVNIRENSMGAGWWIPYHYWQEFLEIVESKEASLTPADKEEWLQIIEGG